MVRRRRPSRRPIPRSRRAPRPRSRHERSATRTRYRLRVTLGPMWRVLWVAVVACSDHHAPPAPTASGSAAPVASPQCTQSSDCVIAAPPTSPCCLHSGSVAAMSRTQRDALPTTLAASCTQEQVVECPPPSGNQDLLAVCQAGVCVAEAHRTTLDLATFSRACEHDSDCTLVQRDSCNSCGCADVPIANTDKSRYLEDLGRLVCTGIAIHNCGLCDPATPHCSRGQCEAIHPPAPMVAGGECASDADCVQSCVTASACCEQSPCETVISQSAQATLLAARPANCRAVRCRAPERPTNITPRCKAGQCFAEVGH